MTTSGIPAEAQEVLNFWFNELEEKDWYNGGDAVDELVKSRFGATLEQLSLDVPSSWTETAQGALAAIIVLDQFPRNIHRGTPMAFATDDKALVLTKAALAAGHDRELPVRERNFLLMPFQHTESLEDQNAGLDHFKNTSENTLDYAIRHRDIVARFGRFPHRNAILGRESTPEEVEFLKQPGSSF